MRTISLTEYQTERAVALSGVDRDAIARAIPSLAMSPAFGAEGRYDLTPSSWIGAYQLGDLTVHISPKLPIERVLFLMAFALDPAAWRREKLLFAAAPTLHEAIIPAFIHHVQAAFRRGLLQGYRSEEDALQTVRGRIRFDDQIRQRFGIFPPVEVRFDEFTPDILPNRLVKAAIARLGRLRVRSDLARASLRSFDSALSSVATEDYHPRRVPAVHWTRLNEHYRPAVNLARLVLSGSVFETGAGATHASGFAVDMNRVFEDFVLIALRESLGLPTQAFRHEDTTLRLDEAGRVRLKPDMTWWHRHRCIFVGDAKYKKVRASGVLHPDLYQILAYAVAADLPGGLLVYAAGEDEEASHEIVHVGRRLEVVTLDLAGSIDDVLAQIDAVAERVRAWSRLARTAA